ncbi:BNR-4 repeat-containing protein [Curtobacterium sp. MCBD17_019]|uniref:BNR-4 repeat-containing protein n=1 Tax=Curtobacterium sp. MCBD17_019 TaxID=2175669 RepID=UPI000DA9141F|nr:BNR-4 repeat-containing protein [Curtobacterium sp. MCBD17_019]PZE78420.1 hypothetical protein DEI82_01235 [Curtobacterium sp. MCBD17_019]
MSVVRTVSVPAPDGSPAHCWAGMMIPQAVVRNPRNGHVLIARYRADRTMGVLDVDVSGATARTRSDTTLLDGAGAAVVFDQGQATATASNGNINDSHNLVSAVVDRQGDLHVTGNNHNTALRYWRTTSADDPTTLRSKDAPGPMDGVWVVKDRTGAEVRRYLDAGAELGACSYPTFFRGPQGQVFLSWRNGESGRGNQFLYGYVESSKRWVSVAGEDMRYAPYPDGRILLEGMSSDVSPYPSAPVPGPDGWWWMVWVWRGDPTDADTNGRLSAARSQDLRQWYGLDGTTLPPTITFGTSGVVVDDLPLTGSGLLNDATRIGFDRAGRPVIAYYKYVGSGSGRTTQLFVARPDGASRQWVVTQVSAWSGAYDLARLGTAQQGIAVTSVSTPVPAAAPNDVVIGYARSNGPVRAITVASGASVGSARSVADAPVSTTTTPPELTQWSVDPARYPGLAVRTAVTDAFEDGGRRVAWTLRWDAGPYRNDGRAPDVAFPAEGSPLTLVLTDVDDSGVAG